MNTEIFDYFKSLAKEEFFLVNFLNTVLGILILILGVLSLRNGASDIYYAIMFASAAVMCGLNSYKGFKRKTRSAIFFAVAAMTFVGITVLFIVKM